VNCDLEEIKIEMFGRRQKPMRVLKRRIAREIKDRVKDLEELENNPVFFRFFQQAWPVIHRRIARLKKLYAGISGKCQKCRRKLKAIPARPQRGVKR
jgi:hypothetical protein